MRDGRDVRRGFWGRTCPLPKDGLKGVAFVEAVVDSHEAADQPWLRPVAVYWEPRRTVMVLEAAGAGSAGGRVPRC